MNKGAFMYKDFREFYKTNTEYYHTINHVYDLLNLFQKYRAEFLHEYPNLNEFALFEAIKWHDSFYIPGYECNENKSAAQFLIYNDNSKLTSDTIDLIDLIITSTKIGYNFTDELPSECKVMHDLDWSGFNDYELFKTNREKIYREAVEVGKFDSCTVRRNQIDFYRKFSEKPLYLTKTFSKFNDIAKENMLKLADELENTYFCERSVFDCTGMFQNMQTQMNIADPVKFYAAIERLATDYKGDEK